MRLIARMLGTKTIKNSEQKSLNKSFNSSQENVEFNALMMHMIYRDGESDADYELENDDYKETIEIKKDIKETKKSQDVGFVS